MAAFGLGGFGDMRGGPGGLGGMGMGGPRGFEEQYHCYPVSFQVTIYTLVFLGIFFLECTPYGRKYKDRLIFILIRERFLCLIPLWYSKTQFLKDSNRPLQQQYISNVPA